MDPTRIGIQAIQPILDGLESHAVGRAAEAGGGGFLHTLKDAIAQVNDVQLQANHAVDELMTGRTQNIHQVMVALQQADISFQLMMQVRNKLVGAYEEIQRMQI